MTTAHDSLTVRPLAGALGAEIEGIDMSRALDAPMFDAIRRALDEHLVVVLRDQTLTPEQQLAVSRRFGPLLRAPYVEPLSAYPDIIAVLKAADERNISVFGGAWHSDFSFLNEPPGESLLYAIEVPDHGGDTLWANMYTAYDALSEGLRETLDGLAAIHSGVPYGTRGPGADVPVSASIRMARNDPTADAETAHPVVRRHPRTGRKALFVNPIYTTRFADMTEAESRPLLDFLQAHASREEFTCRLRWTPGALAIWDNRCTQHLAINDYDGVRRLLHRTTVAGERPLPARAR